MHCFGTTNFDIHTLYIQNISVTWVRTPVTHTPLPSSYSTNLPEGFTPVTAPMRHSVITTTITTTFSILTVTTFTLTILTPPSLWRSVQRSPGDLASISFYSFYFLCRISFYIPLLYIDSILQYLFLGHFYAEHTHTAPTPLGYIDETCSQLPHPFLLLLSQQKTNVHNKFHTILIILGSPLLSSYGEVGRFFLGQQNWFLKIQIHYYYRYS